MAVSPPPARQNPNPGTTDDLPDRSRGPVPAAPLAGGRVGRLLLLLLTILAAAAVAALAWIALARFAHLLLIIILALLVAFVFSPTVGTLERRGLPRVAAIAVTYLGTIVLLALVLLVFLGPLITQLATLIGQLPKELTTVQSRFTGIDSFFISHHVPLRMAALQNQLFAQTQTIGTVVLSSTLTVLAGLTSAIVDFFLVLVLSFYFLLDTRVIHNNLVRLIPAANRTQLFFIEAAFVKVVGGYIRGQLLMAVTIGTAAGVGCWLLHVPYPLVIGLLAGVFELMPMVGPILGAVPAVLISLTQGFPLVVWVVLLFIVIQQVEFNVIGPRITGHAVGLHPLGAMLSLLAGVELGGILGALFAVPAAGILYVLAVAVYWQWHGQSVPTVTRGPSRVVGLARGVMRRRAGESLPRDVTPAMRPAPGVSTAAAVTRAPAGDETALRPDTLVSLDREAEHLRVQFEQDEQDRQADDAAALDAAAATLRAHPHTEE